jgi:hypothetical protein
MEQNFKKQIIEISNKGFPLNSYSKTIEQFLGTKPLAMALTFTSFQEM